MRIDDTITASSDLRSQQIDRTQDPQAEPKNRARREAGGDSVQLSGLGADLARALSQDSPQEITRVEQAQQAFQEGTLRDEPEQVADALLSSAVAETRLEGRLGASAAPPSPGPA